MSDTDCRLKDGHRYVDGRCVWCDALQEVSNSGADLTGTVLDDRPLTEDEFRSLHERPDIVIELRQHGGDSMDRAADEIECLRIDIRHLRTVLQDAIEWDGQDDCGVDAVWLEAALDCLKGTSDGR